MGSRRLATFLLALLSGGVALGVAEIVLRSVKDFAQDSPSEFIIPHPVLGWSLEPGARYRTSADGEGVEVAYNRRGWRDVEHAPGPSTAPRIVLLGDSFMEGYTVALERSFHRRLQAELRPTRPGLEVINLGVSGFGSLQSLLAYQIEGARYAPDLVLLGFLLQNDVRDNSLEIELLRKPSSRKARARPFLLPGEGWELTVVEQKRSRARYEAALARRHSWWWRFGDVSRLWRVALAEPIDRALRNLAEGPEPETTLTRPERQALELAVFACEPVPEYERAWKTTDRILTRLARVVRESGARLVVFTVPSEIEASPAPRGLGGTDLPCRKDPPAYEHLRTILARERVPLIDLLPAFQRVMREPGEQLFVDGDAHWNARGHALAATEVARGLEALGLPQVAPPAGLEPATHGLGNRRSIL